MAVIARLGREQIDGRPLYQYRIDLELLAGLEVLINHPCSTDAQKILALAPVAVDSLRSDPVESVSSRDVVEGDWTRLASSVRAFDESVGR